jgi:hypothetical protein
MRTGAPSASKSPAARHEIRLWLALFGPATAFFVVQQLGFLLSSWICATGRRWVLYPITAAGLCVAAAGGLAAWKAWSTWSRNSEGESPRDPRETSRLFLAAAATILGLFFFVAILSLTIPELVHRPCD